MLQMKTWKMPPTSERIALGGKPEETNKDSEDVPGIDRRMGGRKHLFTVKSSHKLNLQHGPDKEVDKNADKEAERDEG